MPEQVIYQDRPKFNILAKFDFCLPILLLALTILTLFSTPFDPIPTILLLAFTVLSISLLWWTTPSKYFVMEDRVRVIFGFGVKKDLLFTNIAAIGNIKHFGFGSFINSLLDSRQSTGDGLKYARQAGFYPFNNVIAIKVKEPRDSMFYYSLFLGFPLGIPFAFLSPQNVAAFYEKLTSQIKIHNIDIKLLGL